MTHFDVGKLPHALLDKCLKKIVSSDPRVIVGPRLGEDAAVIDMGDRYLVVTTDPITFTEERIGWYGVSVNANDVATMGAKPCWFLATLLLPEGRTDERLVELIFDDILESCQALDVTLCGGHTEITAGLTRPILVGQMMGEVVKDRLVMPSRIVPGDAVLLTQGIAIEGTAILAAEKGEVLSDSIDSGLISRARGFLDDPGISVVRAALTACAAVDVHGMHDPTEGGIATGLWELAQACGHGLRIDEDAVPVFPETEAFGKVLGLDVWGLIASGALLIVVAAGESERAISALSEEGIPCTRVGSVVSAEEGLSIVRGGKKMPLRPFARDELARIL
ncbi:MAG: AIR synthase family protein [bacterium]